MGKSVQEAAAAFPKKGLALGIVMIVAYQLFFSYAGAHFSAYQRWGLGFMGLIAATFFMVLITSLLPIKFTAQDLAIAYSMILWANLSSHGEWTFIVGYNLFMQWQGFRIPGRLYNEWLPTWVFPKTEDLTGYFNGRSAINWGVWAIPILANIAFLMSLTFAGMFFALILRKPWVDTEKMPFPFATPAVTLIQAGTPSAETKAKPSILSWTRSKFLYTGIILGFLVMLPEVIYHGFGVTWFPVPSKLYAGRLRVFQYDFSDIIPIIPAEFSFQPFMVALFYLAPADFLFSAWFWYFLSSYVLGPLQVYMGIIPPPPNVTPAGVKSSYLGVQGPIKMHIWGGLGGFVALGLIGLGLHWRHLVKSLKCVVQPDRAYEANEPIPYRWMWIGFVVCSLIVIAFLTALGIPLYASVLGFIFVYFLYLCNARLRGEGGTNAWYFPEGGGGFGAPISWFGWGIGLPHGPNQPGTTMYYMWTYNNTGYPFGVSASMPGVLESFRIAADTNLRLRPLFVALTVSIVLTVVLGLIGPLSAYHIWGSQKYIGNPWVRGTWQSDTAYTWASSATPINTFGGTSLIDPQGFWIYHMIFGVILMLGFQVARAVWPWFPLNVAGIAVSTGLLGWGGIGSWGLHPVSFFIAWLAKVLVVRAGGATLYGKSIPLVVGIIIGCSVALAVEQLAITFRYLPTIPA